MLVLDSPLLFPLSSSPSTLPPPLPPPSLFSTFTFCYGLNEKKPARPRNGGSFEYYCFAISCYYSCRSVDEGAPRNHYTLQRSRQTLTRLQNELHDLVTILDSLKQVIDAEASMLALLQGPIERCTQVCREFEQSMETFGRNSKTGFRDWTKMEFMRGDINEFIDTISGYKSTISVGLGTVTMFVSPCLMSS